MDSLSTAAGSDVGQPGGGQAAEQGLGAGAPRAGAQFTHKSLKFICFGCGKEYRDFKGFVECIEDHEAERALRRAKR